MFLCVVDLKVADPNLLYLQLSLPEFFAQVNHGKIFLDFYCRVVSIQKTAKGKMKFLYVNQFEFGSTRQYVLY